VKNIKNRVPAEVCLWRPR